MAENRVLKIGDTTVVCIEGSEEEVIGDLPETLVDANLVLYWYESGDYDGGGYMLVLKEDGWRLHGMGHCSCYGPLDELPNSMDSPPHKTYLEAFGQVEDYDREKQEHFLRCVKEYIENG